MMKSQSIHLIRVFTFLLLSFVFFASILYSENENIKIKVLAVNPSATETLKTTIREAMPPEVTPDDVLDKEGVTFEYNKEKKVYELVKEVELAPKETKTIIVPVRNVWAFSEEELAETQKQLEQSLEALKGTKYDETAQLLYSKLSEKLGQIEASKTKDLGMRERIEIFRAQQKELEEIKTQSVSFAALRRIQEEQEHGVVTAKFVITAENGSDTKQTLTVRSLLPKDVTPDVIIDKLNFNLLFDKDRNRFVLEKDDEFGPGETKKYEIILRDIWRIPQSDIDILYAQSEKLLNYFKGTMFERYASHIGTVIADSLKSISALQEEVASGGLVEDRIRAFVLNTERMELVKKKLKELQDLLLEIPMKSTPSPMDELKKALKEFQKTLGKILSLGFQPNLSTTWWIILGIIGFLFAMSTSFYVTWITRLGKAKWGKKSGGKKPLKETAENTETKNEGS